MKKRLPHPVRMRKSFFHAVKQELFLKTFHEFAVSLVLRIEFKIFVEIFLGLCHVFLVEIVVAHVVVHHLGVVAVARAVLTCLKELYGLSVERHGG